MLPNADARCPAHVERGWSGLYRERSARAKRAWARRVDCSELLGADLFEPGYRHFSGSLVLIRL
jgi:hypothetical protein